MYICRWWRNIQDVDDKMQREMHSGVGGDIYRKKITTLQRRKEHILDIIQDTTYKSSEVDTKHDVGGLQRNAVIRSRYPPTPSTSIFTETGFTCHLLMISFVSIILSGFFSFVHASPLTVSHRLAGNICLLRSYQRRSTIWKMTKPKYAGKKPARTGIVRRGGEGCSAKSGDLDT